MNPEPTQHNPTVTLTPERFAAMEQAMGDPKRLDCIAGLVMQDGMRILDIGGAKGKLLSDLAARSGRALQLFNLDISDYYAGKQLDAGIQFVCGSILDARLEEASFDIVTFRHVLHHLVASNIRATLENQRQALERMCRLLKPGGHLVFEEEVNNVRLFSRMVYHLSKWASDRGIVLKAFDTARVVVSFMTPGEIRAALDALASQVGMEVERCSYQSWPMPLRWKLTILMSRVGSVFYVVRRRRGSPPKVDATRRAMQRGT
ncbi:MAG: class I SAM-dependent methyltransferase [Verrucomicrobia bacterium]|nr:class I SAM-dependent methyltransferase [Verrucomicrobiota bacterium]